ncbi:MAG: exosortase/archaeosortase family protein [Candidatus Eisenbacteria bacterium]|uniref:Exosortase/archaeosortase family protein n=1 Tax=Eiseniibacteriota bacterium TaxID=2212470 RepID=A0A9D6QMR5_UNCEI|nr:exosortase/archaeosortase family protein [Candidatus Eisenbacteria bacterium]
MSRAVPLAAAADRGGAALRRIAALAVVAILLVAVYHRAAATLWNVWTTNDDYSHGPLVPLVATAMAWTSRARLAGLPSRTDARGLALVALACALQIVGMRADVFALQGYSLVVMASGLVWTFLGAAWLRALAFPLGYLVFMLPFPPIVMNGLAYALKEITVRISTRAAEALGVQLQQSGMTLYLASGVLRVENPCSGLRSLLALLATATAFARFQPGALWRRAALLAAGIPIAVLGNAVRLTLLILIGHYAGVAKATGWVHDASGYVLFAAALAALFAMRRLLTPRGGAGAVGEGA